MSGTDAQVFGIYQSFQLDLARAVLGLDCLFAATSLGLGIGALVLLRRRPAKFRFAALPQWAVIGFLWVNFLYGIFSSARYGFVVHGPSDQTGNLEDWYLVGNILPFLLLYAGNCALIYIIYYTLHLVQAGCPKSPTPSDRRVKIRWALVALCTALSIVDWGLLTKAQLMTEPYEVGYMLGSEGAYAKAYVGFDTATYLVRLGISGEIMWCAAGLCVSTIRRRSRWRVLSILLLITATFFLALNLMWTIFDIIRLPIFAAAATGSRSDGYYNAYYTANICQVCFYLIIYVGLISFCLRWGWLARRDEKEQAERDEKEESERAKLPPEADSRPRAVAEVDGQGLDYEADSAPVNEVDSVAILEADSTRVFGPPVELDSSEVNK